MRTTFIRKFLSLTLGIGLFAPTFAFAASHSMMMEHDSMMMPDEHMSMMMTEGLSIPCADLRKLSVDKKKAMLTEIGHNMDFDALRPVFRCMFRGGRDVKRVAVISDNDLKINPHDREFLYYVPQTEQFFVTCKSMRTLAYVVDAENAGTNRREWRSYFQFNRKEFADTAQMAKDMMQEMMPMDMEQ